MSNRNADSLRENDKSKSGADDPLTVPSPIDTDMHGSYNLIIAGIRGIFQPVGQLSTLVWVPKGYDETFFHTRQVKLCKRETASGEKELFIPAENLVLASILKVAHSGNNIYYLVSVGGREVIVNERFCAPLSSKIIGPFRAK